MMEISNLTQMKVANLKAALKSRGLSVVGNKNELIQRLESALMSESTENIKEPSVKEIDEEAILGGDDDASLTKADESLLHNEDLLLSETSIDTANLSFKAKSNTEPVIVSQPISVVSDVAFTMKNTETKKTETVKPTVTKPSITMSVLTTEEQKQLRLQKFADPKLTSRAERFGTPLPAVIEKSNEIQKLKSRAERFGEVVSTKVKSIDEIERLEKRRERFGTVDSTSIYKKNGSTINVGPQEKEKIMERQKRFGIVEKPQIKADNISSLGQKRRRYNF